MTYCYSFCFRCSSLSTFSSSFFQTVQTQQNHFTVYLDKNKDGTLSRDELRDWLIPPYNKHEAEAWRLITLADEDKDRNLAKDELLAHFHHFTVLLPPDFWAKFTADATQTAHDEL